MNPLERRIIFGKAMKILTLRENQVGDDDLKPDCTKDHQRCLDMANEDMLLAGAACLVFSEAPPIAGACLIFAGTKGALDISRCDNATMLAGVTSRSDTKLFQSLICWKMSKGSNQF